MMKRVMTGMAVLAAAVILTGTNVQAEAPAQKHRPMMKKPAVVEPYFAKALQNVGKNNAAASDEILKAADSLRDKAATAGADQKQSLLASAAELQALAGQVRSGTATSKGQLETAFAKARAAEKVVPAMPVKKAA